MRRFVYRPEVEAYIWLEDAQRYVDVTDDIIDCSITRKLNAVSTASLSLQNRDNRYLELFKPMDRIAIWLTRTQRMLAFTGYLDEATVFAVHPRPIKIEASCTLKLLQNTYFDPGLPFMQQFFAENGNFLYDPSTGNLQDAELRFGNFDAKHGWAIALRAVLTKIGGFPDDHVHITNIPKGFLNALAVEMKKAVAQDQQNFQSLLSRIERLMNTATRGSQSTSSGTNDFGNTNAQARTFRKALKKHAGGLLNKDQQYNAGVVWGVAKEFGFTDLVSIGLVASAYGESSLHASAIEQGGSGAGLFQLTSDSFYGPNGWLAKAYKKDHPKSHPNPINPATGGGGVGTTIAGNPTYNTRAFIMAEKGNNFSSINNRAYADNAIEIGEHDTPINFSAAPYKQIIIYWERPRDHGVGDIDRASKLWPALLATVRDLEKSSGTSEATVPDQGDSVTSSDPETNAKATAGKRKSSQGASKKKNNKRKRPSIKITHFPAGTVHTYGTQTPKRIILHCTDGDGSTRNLPSAWDSSPLIGQDGNKYYLASQYAIDNDGTIFQFAKDTDLTYHTGGANTGSIGIEQQGRASRTLADWRSHPDELENCARLVAVLCDRHNIPVVKDQPGITDVGISTHAMQSAIHPESQGHTDPGAGFPLDWFIRRVATLLGKVEPDQTPDDAGDDKNGVASTADIAKNANLGFFSLQLQSTDFAESTLLQGKRALANDVSLFEWIQTMATAGGRSFCSLPNGDFYAFFPDYFRWFGERTPYFLIEDIEIIDLSASLSDRDLRTHVFTAGSRFSDQVESFDRILSQVASVEDETGFNVFVNFGRNGHRDKFNAIDFLKRFGARPEVYDMPQVRHPVLLWMAAWTKFAQMWAEIYLTNAEFTFMPELLPGGLVSFGNRFTMFVEEVRHDIDRSSGFRTTATLKAPSAEGKNDFLGPTLLTKAFGTEGHEGLVDLGPKTKRRKPLPKPKPKKKSKK